MKYKVEIYKEKELIEAIDCQGAEDLLNTVERINKLYNGYYMVISRDNNTVFKSVIDF